MLRNVMMCAYLFLFVSQGFSQFFIRGVVSDSGGTPLLGANVFLKEIEMGVSTGSNGNYTISVPKKGSYTFSATFLGYAAKDTTVDVSENLELNFLLTSQAIIGEDVMVRGTRAGYSDPYSFTTHNRQEIQQVLIGQEAPFILERLSPSVVSYSESGSAYANYAFFSLRGIDQTRVNITLNGVPLNDMIDQGVFFSNFPDFSNNIESVQVQRGVGTTSNGTASYAGSVSYETGFIAKPKPSAEIQLVAGSFGTYRGSMGVETGVMANKMAFSASFTTTSSEGYRHHTQSDARSFYGSAAYFGLRDNLKVNAFIGRSQNGLAYLPAALSDIENDPKTNYLNENDRDDFGQWFVQALHTHKFNNQLNLVTGLYYQGAGGDYFYSWTDSAGIYQINYPLRNDHVGLISTVNYSTVEKRFNLNTGIHAYRFERKNWEQLMPDKENPYYSESSQKDEISIFGKASQVFGSITFFADVQMRIVQLRITPDKVLLPNEPDVQKEWFFVNPKAGMNYRINPSQLLYLSFGRTGREPTKVDLFGGFQLNASNLPYVQNDSVKPEFVNDLELGWKLKSTALTLECNVFYMDFTNEIAPIGEFVEEGFLQLRKNMEQSVRTGVEALFLVDLFDHFQLQANGTWLYSRIEKYVPTDGVEYNNVAPSLSPQWIGNGTLSYSFLKRFTAALSGRYQGNYYLEPTNDARFKAPSSFVTNASVMAKLTKNIQFDFFLNNLFNAQYFNSGAPVDTDWDGAFDEPGYFVQPPRNFYIKMQMNF